jgi:transglutaminase-like putative cysteine protease
MNPVRGGFAGGLALAAAAAGTTWLALLSWRGFTEQPASFLVPLLVLGAVIAGTGAVARWARVSSPLVVLCQVVVSGALASTMLSGSPIPVGPAWARLQDSFADALISAERYTAPLPSHVPPVDPILIAGGFACLLLVDFLACTLRRAPLAGLPLLTIYSVPVSILLSGVSWVIFAATAGGFLLMLFLQESEQVARWGRPLGDDAASDPSAFGVRSGAIRAAAGTIGGVATALAVFLPLLIPTLDLSVFRGGIGQGGGDIAITNPMTDLRRDLQRGDDIPLVQVRTTDPDLSYLRISVLTRFSANEWTSGNRQIPTNQVAGGDVPALEGVAETVARTETEYDVAVTPSFRSIWLPTQAPISRITADGDWRYDRDTMDFLAGDDDLDTAGLAYSMTGVDLELSAVSMARAPSTGGVVSSDYLDLPDGIPSEVSNLAYQVTRKEGTRFEKAVALQQWFREDGGFTYDLDASPGNGTDDLVRFLTEGEGGRTGYCEQFASAMAVLSRILGVPARVAVGFYQPRKIGPQTWEYSAWDLHAWPELFFPGSGWVRFEPTPPRRAAEVPDYTAEQINLPEGPGGPGLPRPSELRPSLAESSIAPGGDAAGANDERDGQGGFPWAPVLGAGGGLLLALGLLFVPSVVRRARTRGRVGAGPEAAWAELLDTATDLGVPWPVDRSPRETRDALVDSFGLPVGADTPERPEHGPHIAPLAVEALDRIVLCVERLRYARAGQQADSGRLDQDLATCVASLQGGATRAARRRAAWLPRSVLSRRRQAAPAPEVEPLTVRYGGVVDHVG